MEVLRPSRSGCDCTSICGPQRWVEKGGSAILRRGTGGGSLDLKPGPLPQLRLPHPCQKGGKQNKTTSQNDTDTEKTHQFLFRSCYSYRSCNGKALVSNPFPRPSLVNHLSRHAATSTTNHGLEYRLSIVVLLGTLKPFSQARPHREFLAPASCHKQGERVKFPGYQHQNAVRSPQIPNIQTPRPCACNLPKCPPPTATTSTTLLLALGYHFTCRSPSLSVSSFYPSSAQPGGGRWQQLSLGESFHTHSTFVSRRDIHPVGDDKTENWSTLTGLLRRQPSSLLPRHLNSMLERPDIGQKSVNINNFPAKSLSQTY